MAPFHHCPVCDAEVTEFWRREGTKELAVCKACSDLCIELGDALARRLTEARETADLPAWRLVRRMAHDFFGGAID
jgi:hypothetical protein